MRTVQGETLKLIPLRTPISNGALVAGRLPSRLKVLGWGENPSVKGIVTAADRTARVLLANQKSRGFEKVALDFEHNTVPGSPEYERSQEPRKVAGYGTLEIIPAEGVFLNALEWTPAGQADALNFADLSPAVELDAEGHVLFIHSIALTRAGAVEGLSFFNVHLNTKPTMAEKFITLAALAALFSLPDTASEADVIGKLKDRLTPASPPDLTPLNTQLGTLDARVKKIEEAGNKGIATLSATLDGKVITLSAEDLAKFGGRIEKLESTLTASATSQADRERGELIARFSADGKVPLNAEGKAYTDEELKQLDVPTLKILAANTPVTVPLQARGKKPSEAKSTDGLTGLAKAIAAHKAEQQ